MAFSLLGERPASAALPVRPFTSFVRRIAQAVKARRNRIELATLLDFEDHRLWDLGVTRHDVARAINDTGYDIERMRNRRRTIDVWPPR